MTTVGKATATLRRAEVVLGLGLAMLGAPALAQQQVQCAPGTSTTVSGTVYAPNGVDPLPGVVVYVPTTPVGPLADGISCPLPGQLPPGNPLVGATTAVDGTYTLANVPAGNNIPVVIQAGKWRRQLVVPNVNACTNTTFNTRFARNQTEGDIPKFAVSTGDADQVECVLRKIGVDDAEFTDPGGSGRVQLFKSVDGPGAQIDRNTPSANALMGDGPTLNGYDILMLPCEGSPATKNATQLTNLRQYTDGGGRVYASHYSYDWFWKNSPFDTVAQWTGSVSSYLSGVATVDQSTGAGVLLAQWLQLVGASTTPGQIALETIRIDIAGINPPSQAALRLNAPGNPVMQFTFATPVQATQQCGRVLFDEYHVENTSSSNGETFPAECSNAPMTAQEKLLEYSLFDLANNGGPASMTPLSADFGNVAVGYASAPKTFTVTNNSIFGSGVTSATTTGGFAVQSSSCGTVPSGGSCTLQVVAQPTALGTSTGTLTVVFGGTTLKAALTETGVPALQAAASSVSFAPTDVGTTLTQTVLLTNNTGVPLPVPAFTVTGDFAAGNDCSGTIPAAGTCNLMLRFTPTTFGARTGSAAGGTAMAPVAVALSGTGLDFAAELRPTSGSVEAGTSTSPKIMLTPLGGPHPPVTLSCSVNVPGMSCTFPQATVDLSSGNSFPFQIGTTAMYAIVGYGGFGGDGGPLGWWLAAVGAAAGVLVLRSRRRARIGGLLLMVVGLAVLPLGLGGCSGKQPPRNEVYTAPGNYTITVTATDGTLTRSATYSLNVYR